MSSNLKGANAATMKRMLTRKSHSWWWDSHISPKNSKWLAENLEGENHNFNMAKVIKSIKHFDIFSMNRLMTIHLHPK